MSNTRCIDRAKKSLPRLMLALSSILYASAYPSITVMNNLLPPSFTTMTRMILASIPLLPFLCRLERKLVWVTILSGCFDAMAHITLSLSLLYTSPARSSFLGCLPTVMCPILEAMFDKRDISICNAPEMWLAAVLSLSGVAMLEFYGSSDEDDADQISNEALGDGLAVLSAAWMSACFYITERMMRGCTNQVLPITAVQVLVSAVISAIWCTIDRWFGASWTESYGLPSSLFTQDMLPATFAIVWTGLIATDLNFLLETTALSTVSSSEAAVILATEPIWVTLFTFLFLHESFNADDCVGGILIIAACAVIAWKSESREDRAHETETLCEPLVNDCSGGAETEMDASNETESLEGSGCTDLS